MKVTKYIARHARRALRVFAVVPALMLSLTLSACGDKVPAPEPAEEVERAAESLLRERSARQVAEAGRREAEARIGGLIWLAVLGSGAGLAVGLAVGVSRSRRDVAGPNPSMLPRPGVGGAVE